MEASQRDLPVTRLQSADASPLRSRWVGMVVGTYLGVMGCGGGGSTDVAGGTVPRGQPPNTRSAAANASSLVTSPTMARIMLFGTKY